MTLYAHALSPVFPERDSNVSVLSCCRFSSPDAIRQLPVWVRPHVQKFEAFGAAMKDVMVFFKHAKKTVCDVDLLAGKIKLEKFLWIENIVILQTRQRMEDRGKLNQNRNMSMLNKVKKIHC